MELSSYEFFTVHSRGGPRRASLCQAREEMERAMELRIREHVGAVQKYSAFSKAEVVEELGVEERSSKVSLMGSWALEQWVQWWRLWHSNPKGFELGLWSPTGHHSVYDPTSLCDTSGHPHVDNGFAMLYFFVQCADPCLVPVCAGIRIRQARSSLRLNLRTSPFFVAPCL